VTSDEELLVACRIGDSEAFVTLVRRYQRRVALLRQPQDLFYPSLLRTFRKVLVFPL